MITKTGSGKIVTYFSIELSGVELQRFLKKPVALNEPKFINFSVLDGPTDGCSGGRRATAKGRYGQQKPLHPSTRKNHSGGHERINGQEDQLVSILRSKNNKKKKKV